MDSDHLSFTDPWASFKWGEGLGVPVAIGGELTPGAILGAHRRAVFCQPRCDERWVKQDEAIYGPDVAAGDIPVLAGHGNPFATLWWSPPKRYVIRVGQLHMGRTLRKEIRRRDWVTTVDADFNGVIAACRADREPRWITDRLVAVMQRLKLAGWMHTIEVWDNGNLVGGLFGCAIGQVFIMESAFHRQPHAAKIAIADLALRVRDSGITLLDAEVQNDYTTHMGAVPIPRQEYLPELAKCPGPKQISTKCESALRLLEHQL